MKAKKTQQEEIERLLGSAITIKVGGKAVKLKEPTLGVLDLMSREWLKLPDLEFNDDMSNVEVLAIAKRAIIDNSQTIAKSIAIGIVGEGCFVPLVGAFRVWLMTRRVWRKLTHAECRTATEQLSGMAGLMDFIVSMKLMSASATTTKKGDIE